MNIASVIQSYSTKNKRCVGNPFNRKECGYPGISHFKCESTINTTTGLNCCYDDRLEGVLWCFQGFVEKSNQVSETIKSTTEKPQTASTVKQMKKFWNIFGIRPTIKPTNNQSTTTTTTRPPRRSFWNFFGIRRTVPKVTTTTTTATTTATKDKNSFTFQPTPDIFGNTVASGSIFQQLNTQPPPPPDILAQFTTPDTNSQITLDEKKKETFNNFLNSLGLDVDNVEVLTVKPGTGALGTNIAASVKPPEGGSRPIVDTTGVNITTAICSYFAQTDDVPKEIQEVFEESLGKCDEITTTVAPQVANQVLREQIQSILAKYATGSSSTTKSPTASNLLSNLAGVNNFITGSSSSSAAQNLLSSLSTSNQNPFANLLGNNNLGSMSSSNPLTSLLGGSNSNPLASLLGGSSSNPLASLLGGSSSNPLASLLGGSSSNPLASLLGGSSSNPLASLLGSSSSNPLASLLGGSTSSANPLASLLGGSSSSGGLSSLLGGSSTNQLLLNLLQSQNQQKPTEPSIVGGIEPSFIPTPAPRKPNPFFCNLLMSKMESDEGSLSTIFRLQFFTSGCLQNLFSNPALLLQDGALDRIKEILGLGSDDDSDASTSIFEGPIDLGLISDSTLKKCLERRMEYVRDYNCKVGANINIKTEQECTNLGCVYAAGNLCFRCPLITNSAEANKIPSKTCSLPDSERVSCPGFSSIYGLTSFFGRKGNLSPLQSYSSSFASSSSMSQSHQSSNPASTDDSVPVIGSRTGVPSIRQGLSSLLGLGGGLSSLTGGGSSLQSTLMQQLLGGGGGGLSSLTGGGNSLQSTLMQQILGSGGGGGFTGLSGLGNQQNQISNILLKRKCASLGCCWDERKNLFGVSPKACYVKAYPKSVSNLNSLSCYESLTCGVATTSIQERIINGVFATANTDRPWQVLITKAGDSTPRCSGIIICSEWILTTASCLPKEPSLTNPIGSVPSLDTNLLQAFVGVLDPSNPLATGQAVEILKIVVHPGYVITQNINNIALIKIKKLTFTSSIRPICLPTFATNPIFTNLEVFVAGYGKTQTGATQSILKQIPLKTISYSSCKLTYKTSLPVGGVFCANPKFAGEDTCIGDGGSPAIVRNSATGAYTLVGLNFGGSIACDGSKPLVFTDIARYRYWIVQSTNGCCPTTSGRFFG